MTVFHWLSLAVSLLLIGGVVIWYGIRYGEMYVATVYVLIGLAVIVLGLLIMFAAVVGLLLGAWS